jgi:hypothetical protein
MQTTNCLNLLEALMRKDAMDGLVKLTGNKYKIVLDESWQYASLNQTTEDRLWYELIPCRGKAMIYLTSLNPMLFALYTPSIKSARSIVKQVPTHKAEWLDGEAVLTFSPEVLDQIAELAGARKKRRLSTEAKTKLIASGVAHQFPGKFDGVEGEKNAQI